MKARVLRKILNDTKYTVANYKGYIAIGSPMCHDLIKVTKETLGMEYALDYNHRGRETLQKDHQKELLFIWDKLAELIASGDIKPIIEENDVIENPITIYTVRDGELITTFTAKNEYPNTTIDGFMIHNGEYHTTKLAALKDGIKEEEVSLEYDFERIKECGAELKTATDRFLKTESFLNSLKRQLKALPKSEYKK